MAVEKYPGFRVQAAADAEVFASAAAQCWRMNGWIIPKSLWLPKYA
ncbi:hypothetical protein [Rhizobium sp. AG855]|nr:hypothetical protein [Rhizobium sp. AG855]